MSTAAPSAPSVPVPSAGRPFAAFVNGLRTPSPLRAAITSACRLPEPALLPGLLAQAQLPEALAQATQDMASRLAQTLRQRESAGGKAGIVQGLLQEFALSSQEGVALMCLAEALLRIPDKATRDALIRDKISAGNWEQHLGHSPSLFVNAATWGLLLTGKLVATHSESGLSSTLGRIIGKSGEPLIRKGVDMAMRMMGEQFVTGETIAQALSNATKTEAQGFRYSYDMLGEAAMTSEDAQAYLAAYEHAIHAIGKASARRGVYDGPGISVKLSALHPRYSRAQVGRVMGELYPCLLRLALLARQYDIGLNIDAEEADRLEPSLDLLERLCFEPALAGWNGIGFVVQAYQKRCPQVIAWLLDLAQRSQHRLMVRLVKGAYWDSEIKRAQVDGLEGFPVYTRKMYTDVAYLACARQLLAAPDAVYPQFATHNAHTLAAIYQLAGPAYHAGQYEFQCLHGMGEPLYEQVVGAVAEGKLGRPCRIYAPVGTHETLLAYLVRRLLENGANTSFVNRIADAAVSIEELVLDPVQAVKRAAAAEGTVGLPHPGIPLPCDLYGAGRRNASGLDLSSEQRLAELAQVLQASADVAWQAGPMLGAEAPAGAADAVLNPGWSPVCNPSDHRDQVGQVQDASMADVDLALQHALAVAPAWAATPPTERAAMLVRAADLLEADMPRLLGLLVREAGKTFANAVSEVREAVDFLRYYAGQVCAGFDPASHVALHMALGPVVCISPWNFPLAIFIGQVSAALAAGNPVLAKPAEQTPLVAAQAVRVLWQAGVPRAVVQLLPGRGETVGARLVGDPRVQGVMFTGSTAVARLLQRNLAARLGAHGGPVPLIAETGGQNAMIVDSSALVEQVVADVVASAFDSAGQRCSALRVLCVQEDAADRVVHMLKGAMAELRLGNPERLAVDVGPVIDADALAGITRHIEAMRARGRAVFQSSGGEGGGDVDAQAIAHGTFVPPTLIELDSLAELQQEIFGPVLHLVRYRRQDLDRLLDQINATGYGLTLGLHTRIDETIAQVVARAHAGNLYVNRNMVGAVVGVQPFGGEGLSGTGPKAGGPLYLLRLLAKRPAEAVDRALAMAWGTGPAPASVALSGPTGPLLALQQWAQTGWATLVPVCASLAAQSRSGRTGVLAGPTGERNSYSLLPRERVLCLAANDHDRLVQLAMVLAVGSRALWPAQAEPLYRSLPAVVRASIDLAADWAKHDAKDDLPFDAVLHCGDATDLRAVCLQVAQRGEAMNGAIVSVHHLPAGDAALPLERLLVERSLSVNTAAAGGNASLMTMG